ncbi:MAG TPA: hypothetical protein VFW11_18740 [Cyclobacteriaceae bacterium]|nr:hypothetical protein [Cyclobacteriaceae bacterium]
MKFLSFVSQAFLAMLLLTESASAQRVKNRLYDSAQNKSDWRIGLRYTSDYYYMGRADSAKAPYLSPSIGYFHESGFFLAGSLSYLTSPEEQRVDLIRLSAGYDYYNKNLVTGISLTEYFFSDLSFAVQAEMSTYLNAYAGYDFSVAMLYVDGGLGFSEGTDVFLGVEVNHTFYAWKDRIRIIPSLYLNAGSQKYYNEYYAWRSEHTGAGMGHGHGGANHQASQSDLRIEEYDEFKILDYEADVYVAYKTQKFLFFIAPTWTFPINPSTVTTNNGSYKEELKNGFYWSCGIRLTL